MPRCHIPNHGGELLCSLAKTVCCYVAINNGFYSNYVINYERYDIYMWTVVAQWLRRCATNWKVAGSIPAVVTGFFIDIKSFRLHYGPGVNSASNRNEYRKHFLGVKAAGA